jgi:GNAT superfamily N-acetyltransferase
VQPIVVKRAVAQDAERLTALVRASDAYRGKYASALADYQVTVDYIEQHRVFIAVDPVGQDLLGVYGLVLDPPELDLLFIANSDQRRGVGRQLVEHMIDQARDAGLESVRVVSHPDAEGFYRRMGARRVGMMPVKPPKVTWERPELRFAV